MKKHLFFISIILFSCQEEITLELPQAETKLVVQAAIENGFPPYVVLTRNQGYFEEFNSDTYPNLFVDDVDSVKVWYIDDNGDEISKYLGLLPPELSEIITGEPILAVSIHTYNIPYTIYTITIYTIISYAVSIHTYALISILRNYVIVMGVK